MACICDVRFSHTHYRAQLINHCAYIGVFKSGETVEKLLMHKLRGYDYHYVVWEKMEECRFFAGKKIFLLFYS